MRLIQIEKKITSKEKDKKDMLIIELWLEFDNGHREKIMPYTYKDKDGKTHSNKNVLCSHAFADKLPF